MLCYKEEYGFFRRLRRAKKFGFLGGTNMSVLKSKRGLSKLEFYHNARKMRKELTLLDPA
ncbi:hypothetical protein FACS1894106_5340 [Spirochaetia bacterium]|nr:hypothetical protein FACS1894106_5340 [Spirochaetia bacterium]